MPAAKKNRSSRTGGSERAFLASYDASVFERPSVAVDVVLISVWQERLVTLLLPRAQHPYRGQLVLPGGFVKLDESLDAAAARVLRDKAGLSQVFLEQLFTFGDPLRDPRTRVISVAYVALLSADRFVRVSKGHPVQSVKIEVPWADQTGGAVAVFDAEDQPVKVGFDHVQLIGMAIKRLRGKLDYAPIGYQLLPETFTLLELQRVHQVILGRELNKDSFRRKMLASGELSATGQHQSDVGHRPAELYRFNKRSAV